MPLVIENILRLLLSAALGGAVGLERERNDQPAGLRTNILVAIGACLFTLMSAYGVTGVTVDGRSPTQVDPSRIASQIVVGIGFLGAGAILKHGLSIRGLTTAASLWVVAAIGMTVGFGDYALGVSGAVLTLFSLYALRPARAWVRTLSGGRHQVSIALERSADLNPVIQAARDAQASQLSLLVEAGDEGRHRVTVEARFPRGFEVERFIAEVARVPGVRGVEHAG